MPTAPSSTHTVLAVKCCQLCLRTHLGSGWLLPPGLLPCLLTSSHPRLHSLSHNSTDFQKCKSVCAILCSEPPRLSSSPGVEATVLTTVLPSLLPHPHRSPPRMLSSSLLPGHAQQMTTQVPGLAVPLAQNTFPLDCCRSLLNATLIRLPPLRTAEKPLSHSLVPSCPSTSRCPLPSDRTYVYWFIDLIPQWKASSTGQGLCLSCSGLYLALC